MKKESMQEICTGICLKEYEKEYRKNQYQKLFIEDRQERKEYWNNVEKFDPTMFWKK